MKPCSHRIGGLIAAHNLAAFVHDARDERMGLGARNGNNAERASRKNDGKWHCFFFRLQLKGDLHVCICPAFLRKRIGLECGIFFKHLGKKTAKRLVTRAVPFASIPLGAWSNDRATAYLADRVVLAYARRIGFGWDVEKR